MELAGIELKGPILMASGVLGSTGSSLRRMAEMGAGALVTESLGPEPRDGYVGPNVCEVEGGLLNAMGLPNPGIEGFDEEMGAVESVGVPLIVSVFGSTREEFVSVARSAEELGADALELNLSCPHAEGYGADVGIRPFLVEEVLEAVSGSVAIPVFAKLTPNVDDIVEVGRAAERGGADALVAINTLGPGMAIDVEAEKPVLGNREGGLSGPALHPVAVRCVYDLYRDLETPVIGVGGVRDRETALEMLLAGASAVQVGTAATDEEAFREITRGILEHVERKGYDEVEDLVGRAHGQA